MSTQKGFMDGLLRFFADSKITPLLVIVSILIGSYSLMELPREEEPQIVVPIFDVFVPYPGGDTTEVSKRIVELGERKFWEIPGVEYVYSTAQPHGAMFIVRFVVGEDMEKSLINLYTKVHSNLDFLPTVQSRPLIKPRSIDDVPVMALTFHSDNPDAVRLRRVVAELRQELNSIPNVSETVITGGRKREFQVFFDEAQLAKHLMSPQELAGLIRQANVRIPAGHLESSPTTLDIEPNAFFTSRDDLADLIVGVHAGKPIKLSDVAEVVDGEDQEERMSEIRFGEGAAEQAGSAYPAVTLAISKRAGANATTLTHKVLEEVKALQGSVIPDDVRFTVTRDYGHTAAEKSNELLLHMGIAIFGVSALIALALGLRAAGVVIIAIPTTLALTLAIFHFFGFTINRITLFALIFTIGILVDDPIVGVENIVRHLHMAANRGRNMLDVTIEAIREIISPLMLATLAVIAAILPMSMVGGLMGPYMRPIPIGATAAMVFSMLVSLIVTPWASIHLLRRPKEGDADPHAHDGKAKEDFLTRLYRAYMRPLIYKPVMRWLFILGMLLLLAGSVMLVPMKKVMVKMLPFDNKNEFQVVLNMPEGTSVERTREVLGDMADYILTVPEVHDLQMNVGTSAPYNFNGLVRHYFLRNQPHQADLQVNLLTKAERKRQSHAIAEGVREELNRLAHASGGTVQVAEIPPGPPVLSTLVLEVYGPDAEARNALAKEIEALLRDHDGITDITTHVEAEQPLHRLNVDHQKASLNGISAGQIADNIAIALQGRKVDLAHLSEEPEPVEIVLRLPREKRTTEEALLNMHLLSRWGRSVPISDFVTSEETVRERSIFHKNLLPVSYVLADVTDEIGSPGYAIMDLADKLKNIKGPDGEPLALLYTGQPESASTWAIKWDGEWQITYEVFRDLGIAFAAVLILIFVLVVGWFKSFKTPLIVMLPIPLSLVGILPAHWLTGVFFTATSMIGMIAGAGIVVRNAIILVDFIELKLSEGESIDEAVIDAGAVRFRPMLLTAAAVVVGASVILFDPIFQGLALALIAGEVASTLLARTAVPVLYYMMWKGKK